MQSYKIIASPQNRDNTIYQEHLHAGGDIKQIFNITIRTSSELEAWFKKLRSEQAVITREREQLNTAIQKKTKKELDAKEKELAKREAELQEAQTHLEAEFEKKKKKLYDGIHAEAERTLQELAVATSGRETKIDRSYKRGINIDELMKSIEEANLHARIQADRRDVILVIGNTGAGKSTFVNYLAGCTMKLQRLPGSLKKGVIAENPIMQIGHGFNSFTQKPEVYNDAKTGLTYCDCPGFLDNRGVMFDITNAYATKSITSYARSIKAVVVIINYHSLLADRGRGLAETVQIMNQLFGKDAKTYKASIFLTISQAPVNGEDALVLANLKQFIQEANNPVIDCLLDNVCFYDPLERATAGGALDRQAFIQKLDTCESIEHPNQTFNFVLSVASKQALSEFIDKLVVQIREDYNKNDFRAVSKKIESLEKLSVLDFAALGNAMKTIFSFIQKGIQALQGDNNTLGVLEKIQEEIPRFSQQAAEGINVIKERIRQYNKREEDFQKELARVRAEAAAAASRSGDNVCVLL